jgi:hypothetical protein
VGLRNQNTTQVRSAAARWDGRHWAIDRLGQLKPRSELDSVSCPTVSRCMAVGASPPPPAALLEAQTPVSATLNGARWVARGTPIPAGWQGSLNSVSCASPSDCTAVGGLFTLAAPATFIQQQTILVERWNGRKWTSERT